MKIKIIVYNIAILLIVGITSLIIYGIISNKKHQIKKITGIKSLEFKYSTGNAIDANVSYTIECNPDCYISVKPSGIPDEDKQRVRVDSDFVKDVEKVLNKYNVVKWDGYNKSNSKVLDGRNFSFHIKLKDKKTITASGYMMYPENYKKVKKYFDDEFMSLYQEDLDLKPLIYLYPTEKTDISIKVGYKEKLTISYPEYNAGWEVTAYPDGTLINKKTNKELYSLFWEGYNTTSNGIRNEGFIVEGKDASSFLEEKLSYLGLNDKEIEEFIIYWLPKLKNNKYNYIYFETLEQQNKNMPLIVNPKPDTIIRINMEFKPLTKKINIKEQKLSKTKREGYTLVEWGGTILE